MHSCVCVCERFSIVVTVAQRTIHRVHDTPAEYEHSILVNPKITSDVRDKSRFLSRSMSLILSLSLIYFLSMITVIVVVLSRSLPHEINAGN